MSLTDGQRQELRDWSAMKMGWVYCGNKDGVTTFSKKEEFEGEIYDKMFSLTWQPDTDLNQCFMLVESMVDLGFELRLYCPVGIKYQYCCYFIDGSESMDANPCIAILLAARATEATDG